MRLEFHPSTATDVRQATVYYEQQRRGLGAHFLSEPDKAIAQLARAPLAFPLVDGQVRRSIVMRFPYVVLYRVLEPDALRVLVIRHHKRDPQIGMERR